MSETFLWGDYTVTPNGDIDASLLTPEQRQNLSSLGAAVGAIGGGLVGNSLYNAAVGSQVGQNAVVNNSGKVDALRYWVKDKLSWLSKDELKNNLDVIQNVVAKTASNAIDGAIGTADWANDNLNAVVYCIGLSPSLCQSARNTVDPKNREIIDAIAASIDPTTYKVIAQKFSDAAAGNLQAREEVGLLIGSIIQKKVKSNPIELTHIPGIGKYVPTPKHESGGWGSLMDLDYKQGAEALSTSIQGGKQRYSYYGGVIPPKKAST